MASALVGMCNRRGNPGADAPFELHRDVDQVVAAHDLKDLWWPRPRVTARARERQRGHDVGSLARRSRVGG